MADTAGSRDLGVGLVHWALPPTTGGVESHVTDLASELVRRGCRVTVITGEPAPTPVEGVRLFSTRLLRLVPSLRRERDASTPDPQLMRSVFARVIDEDGLRIIHGHNLHHFMPQPALALTELRERVGFRLHHTFHETWPDLLHDQPVYRSWDGNYAVSRFVQGECARRLGFRPQLLRLGVDTDRFTATAPLGAGSHERPLILHPARLLPWKGVDLSIRMLRMLHDKGIDARLVVTDTQRIVDWDRELEAYRRSIRTMISTLGLTHAVDLVAADREDMPALYESADVVVYPTLADEPFGLVPLEAMSCMRPVVAADCGGIVETVKDGQTGFLFPAGDATTFSNRVARVLLDPTLARRFGREGRRHVVKNFGLGRYVDRILDLYQT